MGFCHLQKDIPKLLTKFSGVLFFFQGGFPGAQNPFGNVFSGSPYGHTPFQTPFQNPYGKDPYFNSSASVEQTRNQLCHMTKGNEV